jgi:hypothetical protein
MDLHDWFVQDSWTTEHGLARFDHCGAVLRPEYWIQMHDESSADALAATCVAAGTKGSNDG